MSSLFSSPIGVVALCAAVVTSAQAQGAATSRAHHRAPAAANALPSVVIPAGNDDEWFDVDEAGVEMDDADGADFAPEVVRPYDLQVASIRTPVPEFVNDTAARLVVEVTVTNAGRDSAPVARLSLDEMDGSKHRPAHEILVPRIAPGKSVTIRVPVAFPTNPDGMICVSGKVEPLVRPDVPKNGFAHPAVPTALALL